MEVNTPIFNSIMLTYVELGCQSTTQISQQNWIPFYTFADLVNSVGELVSGRTLTGWGLIYSFLFITARKPSLWRLCFYTWLSVHGGVPGQVPPRTRYTPLGSGTPPRTRYIPRTKYIPGTSYHPPGRYTPWTRYTPPGTRYALPGRYTWSLTTRYTPLEQFMLGDTSNKRAVRILLECILVFNDFSLYIKLKNYIEKR